MKEKMLNDFQILTYEDSLVELGVTTAFNDASFKFDTEEGRNNLTKLKNALQVKKICYLKQIHSDKIIMASEGVELHGQVEGDSLITTSIDTMIGVFTADCIPVLIWDGNKKVIAAVHSGWKGTFDSIVKKTIEVMIKDFNCDSSSIKVFIGPHIRQCCYEVSEELIDKFKKNNLYAEQDINNGRYLSLEKCIEMQLKYIGVNKDNIIKSGFCTLCEKDTKLHSYRKDGEHSGRMFTYIYLK
ncbi:peptidoglycan editing factor PgeF [Clostridium folliculivorans]|uniref:Purine nucleoside phosphorylase n=1 Tax=Clostridium folliculivorans TaxID=2886038 RepID=A0A9W5Y292_9CLOT|nr:peptidoglycan editing factor PgeF [Clostridium folliculivorans]GKU25288.1 laccase domain protein [Clostridium folliculivorans]GKU28309.1 laccase domain protein [Clostridium folliculivorans]